MITRLYFETLFAQSLAFVEGAPLTREPPSIDRVRSVLAPALAHAGAAPAFRDPGPDVAEAVLRNRRDETAPVGLNTIGMLLDRFSILAIKVWNLSHRSGDAARAQALRSGEVADLAAALATARPGYSSLNTKISVHRVDAEAQDFRSAYTGLLTTNLLLWEAQEVLYNRDIAVLPAEELRQYVSYFSQGNLRRNQFIERSDACYWAGLHRLAGTAREGSGP